MLLILVSNAIKFTPVGGNVEVSCKLIKSAGDLSVKDIQLIEAVNQQDSNHFLEVQVKDTGVGIKAQDQPKLFKLFGFLDNTKEINT